MFLLPLFQIMCIGVLAAHAVSVLAAVSGVAYLIYLLFADIIEEDLVMKVL